MININKLIYNNLRNLFVFLILLIILIIILFIFYSDSEELYTSILVGDHSGFDLNSSALTFGLVESGQSASRAFNITNDYNFKQKFVINGKGEIFKFLTVSDNDFVLMPKESKRITATVRVPLNTSFRTYEGKIRVYQRFSF